MSAISLFERFYSECLLPSCCCLFSSILSIVAATLIDDDSTRNMVLTYLCLAFFLGELLLNPYKNDMHNKLELGCVFIHVLLALLLTGQPPPYSDEVSE
jgi:hypothetical protein